MMKYRSKPVEIDAVQWFKHGDHAAVEQHPMSGSSLCGWCNKVLSDHGWIGGVGMACPGDWVITYGNGTHGILKPRVFEKSYELAGSTPMGALWDLVDRYMSADSDTSECREAFDVLEGYWQEIKKGAAITT